MRQTIKYAFGCCYSLVLVELMVLQMPNIMHFGSAVVQWCAKLAFTVPKSEHRNTIRICDYLAYRNGNLGCVNVPFMHDLDASQRLCLFAKLTLVQPKDVPLMDECLDLLVLEHVPMAEG